MTNQLTVKDLIERLVDESRRQRSSAIVFGALGLIAQLLIVVFAGLPKTGELAGFIFLSLFFSWSLLLIAVFYLRKSSRLAARPSNPLWLALTSKPQLISEIILEIPRIETPAQRNAETVGSERQNVVGNILDGILGGDATPDYAMNTASGAPLKPTVFVKLTDGAHYRIFTPRDAVETVDALKNYAPQAAFVEKNRNNF